MVLDMAHNTKCLRPAQRFRYAGFDSWRCVHHIKPFLSLVRNTL